MYASALLAKQGQAYQAVDINSRVGGATPHQLVGLLFEDLLIALRQAALAAEARRFERFQPWGHTIGPFAPRVVEPRPEAPLTLDLRWMDRP